jgi:hypothetical protein
MVQDNAPVADTGYKVQIMANDNQRLSRVGKLFDLIEAFTLEWLISNCQDLIDKKDFRIRMDSHRKREPQIHSGRVELHLGIDEVTDFRKFNNGIELFVDLAF